MSDVEDTINLAKAEMRTEIKDCLSYVHSIRAEMDELQRTLDDARKEDLDEIKTVRDSIAEWTDKKLQGVQKEIIECAKMVVVLTENCLIEQGIANSLHCWQESTKGQPQ